MRTEKALHLSYADEAGNETQRPVWPQTLAYYEDKHIIGAWRTLRNDFHNFRIDRIRGARIGGEPFGKRRVILLKEWEAVGIEERSEGWPRIEVSGSGGRPIGRRRGWAAGDPRALRG